MHPRLFQFGHLVLPTYAAFFAIAVALGLWIILRAGRLLSLPTDRLWNLALIGLLSVLPAARLVLLLPGLGLGDAAGMGMLRPEAAPAVALGVALGGALCLLYARHAKLPLLRTLDALAPGLALGSSVLAMGAFEAGSDYGIPTTLPWAAVFSDPRAARWSGTPLDVPLHPVQLYAALLHLLIFIVLLWLLQRHCAPGEVAGAWLFLSGLAGFFLDLFRGSVRASPLTGGLLSTGQVVACAAVLAGGLLWLRRPHAAHQAESKASGSLHVC